MYIDLVSDWPAYVFMAAFAVFLVYVIIKGHPKQDKSFVADKVQETGKK